MTMYRAGWLTAFVAVLLVGVRAAVETSPEALPSAFVVVAVACSLVSWCAIRIRGSAGRRRVRICAVASCALVGGTIAVAILGFAELLGWRVGLLCLCILVSSPFAVHAYGRWLRSVPTLSAAQLEAVVRVLGHTGVGYVGVQAPPDPRSLSDEQLCQRWRASCLYLRRRPSTAQVMREVEQRQMYLDEFERRYPRGYAAWLTSGAGTLDYLTPYVIEGRVDHATINWDELTRGRD